MTAAQRIEAFPALHGAAAPRRYLVVSTDPCKLAGLVSSLSSQPAEVTTTYPAAADRHRILALRPDVALLHVDTQSELEELIRELRGWRSVSPTPVLAFVGPRQLDATALPPGVDDFVVEPWDAAEVLARLRRFTHDRGSAAPPEVLEAGPVTLDIRQRLCLIDGAGVELTFIEFEMLKALMAQPNRFLGPAELLRTVWDGRHPVHMVTLRVWIKRLRDKLPPAHRALIETRRSVGYRFALDAAPLSDAG
ncbi:MAG TPA: response regulator transcription factor [Dehalococcoidia bacterium]|nr:response regulator transcription factor [Dehalococcoidia bacterium]